MLWNLPQCQTVCLSGSKFPSPWEVESQSHQRWGWRKAQGGSKRGKNPGKVLPQARPTLWRWVPGHHPTRAPLLTEDVSASHYEGLISITSKFRSAKGQGRPPASSGGDSEAKFSGSRWLGPGSRCRRRCGFWHATGEVSTREQSTRDWLPLTPRSCAVKAKPLTPGCSEGKDSFTVNARRTGGSC